MTAADHVATYEAAGEAAVHAHLDALHANTIRALFGAGAVHAWTDAEVHRYLHGLTGDQA